MATPDYSGAPNYSQQMTITGTSLDDTITGTQIPTYLADASKQIIEQGMSLAGGDFPEFTGSRFKTYDIIPGGTGVAEAFVDGQRKSKMSPADQQAMKILMDTRGDYSNLMGQITGDEGLLTGLGQG